MKEFADPLKRRIYRARWLRERYRSDPAYRLARLNKDRIRRGLPPHTSLDQVASRIDRERER
jgi:hypothetical protein